MGDERSVWLAAHSLALGELQLGRPNDTVQVLVEAVAQIRARGMQHQFVYQIAMLATACVVAGDVQAAGPDLHEAVALLRGEGALWWLGDSLGRVAARSGDGESLGPCSADPLPVPVRPRRFALNQADAAPRRAGRWGMDHSSELPMPNRLSRLVNRLKTETYNPTVAST
jgi:hypothetical protein